MSDMTEREQDAAVIAAYDGAIEESARPNWTFAMGMEYANARNNRRNIYQCAAAMRRTIDRLQADNARLREQVDEIVAIAESYECLAQNPAVETSVSQERLGFAQDIYRALGIEVQK